MKLLRVTAKCLDIVSSYISTRMRAVALCGTMFTAEVPSLCRVSKQFLQPLGYLVENTNCFSDLDLPSHLSQIAAARHKHHQTSCLAACLLWAVVVVVVSPIPHSATTAHLIVDLRLRYKFRVFGAMPFGPIWMFGNPASA